MAVVKNTIVGPNPPLAYYVCSTEGEKPSSGLQQGDLAITLDTNTLYVATSATTWGAVSGSGSPANHVLATTAGLGATHTTSGLAAGQYLRATAATTAAFQTIPSADLGSGTPDTTTFLRGDRTWAAPPGGAGASATIVETNVGTTPVFRGKFTITDAGISASSKVMCWQSPGPYTGKGTRADEATMDPLTCVVEPASGTATAHWETVPRSSPVLSIADGARDISTVVSVANAESRRLRDSVSGLRRLGRVKGNIKFTYVVFS